MSDSIITEIVTGISNDLLIFADITTSGYLESTPIRNGNVMYEIGLAHAVRLPQEVLLFRSDTDHLLFDVSGIRVRSYDPDTDTISAKKQLAEAIEDSVRETDLVRNLAVEKVAKSLDLPSWNLIFLPADEIQPPIIRTFQDAIQGTMILPAIARLLELGVLETEYISQFDDQRTQARPIHVEETMRYRLTRFGRSVWSYGISQLGITAERLAEWREGQSSD